MTQLRYVQIDGVELALFPWEDEATVAAELAALWGETEGLFDPGDPLTEDEILALLGEDDYWRWMAEYNALLSDGAPLDVACAVADVLVCGIVYCPSGIDWAAVEDEQWDS